MGTRERIKDAALRLFVAKGVAETSVREIAQAAGVAQGSLYSHYASKEELAWELFSENHSAIGCEPQSLQRRHDALRDTPAGTVTDAVMGILGAKKFPPNVNGRSVTSTSTNRAGDTGEPRQSHPGGLDRC